MKMSIQLNVKFFDDHKHTLLSNALFFSVSNLPSWLYVSCSVFHFFLFFLLSLSISLSISTSLTSSTAHVFQPQHLLVIQILAAPRILAPKAEQ